jgi:intracellular septation protein
VTLNPQVKLILDILPLATFFAGYKWLGLFAATAALLVVTLAILLFVYVCERRIALAPLITALAVGVFGGLTLWLHDERFIKIKPTLINLIFAFILLSGCAFKKGLLKSLFGDAFHLTERGWLLLSLRWGLFFLALGALNEYVWRNFPTDTWVNFKVFGLMGLTLLFALAQTLFIERHSLPAPQDEKS